MVFSFPVTTACSINNGRCSHFCIPLPGRSRTCACPDGLTGSTLTPGDGRNCHGGKLVFTYSSTCHERPSPVRSKSGPSWQVAAGYRDINTANTVVRALQKWPAIAGGRSPKGPAVAGTTVISHRHIIRLVDNLMCRSPDFCRLTERSSVSLS